MSRRLRPFLACLSFILLMTLGCQATSLFSTDEPPTPSTPESPPVTTQPQAAVRDAVVPAPDGASSPAAPSAPLTFVEAIAADVDSFNPVLATGESASTVLPLLLPSLVGQDPQSGAPLPSELASGWAWSADGRAITFTLRSEVVWSDGQPVTARDVGFTLAALAQPQVDSPLARLVQSVERIELGGDHSLTLGLRAPDCTLLDALRLPILPSHLFAADFSDVRTHPFNDAPTVSAGPFLFASRQANASIELTRNLRFWRGAPLIERYILRVIPSAEERARFVNLGEIDLADVGQDAAQTLQGATGVLLVETLTDGYSFLALNLADPVAPVAGVDANGVAQSQPPHPILGESAVRRAVASGVDFDGIVRGVYGASIQRPTGYIPLPVTWAAANLIAPPYDPEAAKRSLEEAGWIDAGGDGRRERGDDLLQATLIVNDDNPQRVEMARLIGEQLGQIGFGVRLEALPFTRTAEIVLGQQFDMAILGWEHLGAEPARLPFWRSRDDAPGAGLNVTSYQRAEVETLLDAAQVAPGCDLAARGEGYRQAQRIIHEDAVFVPLAAQQDLWALRDRWQGVALAPWSRHSGVERWRPVGD